MSATKWDFQAELERRALASLAKHRKTMLQLPTGGGKTVIAQRIARRNLDAGCRVWFLCHRRELIAQAAQRFDAASIPHGFVQAGRAMTAEAPMQIGSVDSLRGRWDQLAEPDLVIWDEAHRIAAPSWKKLADKFRLARHLGLSATPERLDGKALGDVFADLVCGPQPAELEAMGALARCRVFAPTIPDLDAVRIRAGDYAHEAIDEKMQDRALIGDVVDHYARIAAGRTALVFAVSIEHSRKVVERFSAAGIAAEHVDYHTDPDARASALRRLACGELKILSSVEVFTEGLDIGDVGAVILLRPTLSLRLYLQMVGRGRRTSDKWPDLIVLDHAALFHDHGHPKEDRTWSLTQSRPRGRRGPAERFRRCPECTAAHPFAGTCPECGHDYAAGPPGEADGALREMGPPRAGLVTKAELAKRMGVRIATTRSWLGKGLPTHGGYVDPGEAARWLEERRAKNSARIKAMNADPEFRAKNIARTKAMHADPEILAANSARMKAMRADPEFRARNIARTKAMYADPEFRAKHSARSKARMKAMNADPEFRAKIAAGRALANEARKRRRKPPDKDAPA